MADDDRGSGKGRILAARALTILAVLVALIGMLAFYLERTVLNDDGIETIARELIRNDEVREQVSLSVTEALFANVDVEQAIAERLPADQQGLAPVIAGLTRQGAEQATDRLLQRPRVQDAWVRVVTETQRQLVELLDDEGELVSTEGGEVVLDLQPIVIELGEQVAVIGRVSEQLPDSAGRITIMEADQLETAQTLVRILRVLANWLWIVAFLIAAAAIWLARGRRRIELRALAIGMVAVGLLILLVRRAGGTYLVGELTTDASQPAGWNAWEIVTQGLADRAWLWIILGVLVLAGVWLVGQTRLAARARAAVAPVAARPLWTYGIVAAAIVVLATLVPVFQRGLAGVVVFVVLLVVGVETLRRIVLAERAAPSQ